MRPEAARTQRVIGAMVGSVVGDALGAPFEFGSPGQFTKRFPTRPPGLAGEMVGGGSLGWQPGEWTDDTQMALHVAHSLLAQGGVDELDIFERFKRWAGGARDVGVQTAAVLRSGPPWETAAQEYFSRNGRAAGNGSLMRTTPAAIYFASRDADVTADAARRISALTHGDPAAGDGCVVFHLMVQAALAGDDPLDVISGALALMPESTREKWSTVLDAAWTPAAATEGNGAVWPTLGTAVWALRQGLTFEQAMRTVIDLGGDTDTVACVTGGLLGATYGIQAIPSRWTNAVHGELPGGETPPSGLDGLQELARLLDGQPASGSGPVAGAGIDPVEVIDGIWLSDLDGAVRAPEDALVISLCRPWGRIKHDNRRQIYLTDDGDNLLPDVVLRDVLASMDAARSEGRPVLVHCFGGASRTGLVLRAWLRRSGLSVDEANEQALRLWPHTARWNSSFDAVLERMEKRSG